MPGAGKQGGDQQYFLLVSNILLFIYTLVTWYVFLYVYYCPAFDLLTRSITIVKCRSAFETRAVVVATAKTTKHAKRNADQIVAAFLVPKRNKVMPLRKLMSGFATLPPSVHVENLVSSLVSAVIVMTARR